jgi:putative nucleotidyltransferase with HDIG domain
VKSLRDAIVALGQRQLIQIITAACGAHYFAGKSIGYDLRDGELWQHSVAVAQMAEMVAAEVGCQSLLTVYTAGLLHDIGKTVLNNFVNTYFETILKLVNEQRMCFLEAERQVLGIDHQQLGASIARQWRFPPEVVMAIGHHHQPREAVAHKELVGIVYVANRLVSSMGIGCGVDGFLQPNQDEAFSELRISSPTMEKLMANLADTLDETITFLAA